MKTITILANANEYFLIAQTSKARTKYLNTFDGQDRYTWTSRPKAWRMTNHTGHADRMLARVRKVHPNAKLVPAKARR